MSTSTVVQYARISADAVPAHCRFDTPRSEQGQIVTVSYSTGAPHDRQRSKQGLGDRYKMVEDRSTGKTTYYERIG